MCSDLCAESKWEGCLHIHPSKCKSSLCTLKIWFEEAGQRAQIVTSQIVLKPVLVWQSAYTNVMWKLEASVHKLRMDILCSAGKLVKWKIIAYLYIFWKCLFWTNRPALSYIELVWSWLLALKQWVNSDFLTSCLNFYSCTSGTVWKKKTPMITCSAMWLARRAQITSGRGSVSGWWETTRSPSCCSHFGNPRRASPGVLKSSWERALKSKV